MIHMFCNSHYVSHFAAFFIDVGAKISSVTSFMLGFWCLSIGTNRILVVLLVRVFRMASKGKNKRGGTGAPPLKMQNQTKRRGVRVCALSASPSDLSFFFLKRKKV